MAKKKSVLEKHPVLILLLGLLGGIGVILLLVVLGAVLFFMIPDADGYLVMEVVFRFFASIAAGGLPLFFFVINAKRKKEKIDIKKIFKKNFFIIIGTVIIVMFLSIYGPCKDMIIGPQRATMTDAVVEKKYIYKSHNRYLVGYIDGKKVSLLITGNANRLKRGDEFETITIEYYQNIKEVFDIGKYRKAGE